MTPLSLIVGCYVNHHRPPVAGVLEDGTPGVLNVPTPDQLIQFCYAEFGQVPSPLLTRKVIATLQGLGR